MSASAASHDLLFGLLALQNGLIHQGQLVAAFQAWTLDKSRPLAEHLGERGDLDSDQRLVVQAMVGLHLKKHGGDAERSLAALPAGRSTRESLAGLGDPDVGATLGHVGSGLGSSDNGDTDLTASYAVGTSTSDGQRFRVLRPHARGGLGAVFVAIDNELNREVALKQILDHHADDLVSRQRFLIEAEITGGLEHPGIVPVYGLGAYADGRPYYAMRFIKGDSLKEAIAHFHEDAARKTEPGRLSLELRKLLRRFVDVCNAIEYAHSRGVLHRDIKPGNIIVGKYGETLVVDWGLAKPLGRVEPGRESGERTLVPSSASGSAETLPGSALGTPAYMSPEQAQGHLDRLGPLSDVYSLGSTLYCLLTGRPPFEGEDLGEVLRKVERGDFPSPRQVDPSIDRALEAVCLKAMAVKPEDRYASCRALADDVERWMADEPVTAWRESLPARTRRWARRNRTLVTATAASLLAALIGLVGVLTVQAKANRALTEKNAALLDANRRESASNAALTVASAKVQQRFDLAVDAIRTFHTGVSGDLLLKEKRFEGLREKLVSGAIKFYDRLGRLLEKETDPQSRQALGQAYHDVGKLTGAIGQTDRALAAHRQALDVRRRLAGEAGSGNETRAEVARSLVALGFVLEATGKTSEARVSYEEANALLEPLCRSAPGEASYRADLGAAQWSLGWVLKLTGDPSGGLTWLKRSRDTREALIRDQPDAATVRGELARSYNSIANILYETGQIKEALASYENARSIWQRIAAENPNDPQRQGDYSVSLLNIALVRWQTGQPDKALEIYKEAQAILERVTAANPNMTKFLNYLAYCGGATAELQVRQGRLEEALAAFSSSLKIREQLVAENPKITEHQSELSITYHNLANLLDKLGRTAEAEGIYRRALQIEERLAKEEPKVTQFQSYLAATYLALGGLEFRSGRQDAAMAACEKSLLIRQKLAADNATVTEFRRDLEGCHSEIGELLVQAGRDTEALQAFKKALAIGEKLAAESPTITKFQNDLATHLNPIGLLLLKAGRDAQATAVVERALSISQKIVVAEPSNVAAQIELAAAQKGLGLLRSRAGRHAEAAAAFRRAAELAEGIAGRGRRDVLYSLAGYRALLAGALKQAGGGAMSTEAQTEADRAMSALRQAAASGSPTAAKIRTDADLVQLGERPDFQLLIMDLAFPTESIAPAE